MDRTSVRPREWIGVFVFAALVAGLMLLPYARRRMDERPGRRFTGITAVYFTDGASHLSWARQAADGYWLFESKYAGADAHGHRVWNLLFLVIGRLARLTGWTVVAAYQAVRTVSAVLVLAAVYWFAGRYFPDRRMRWVCLILAATSAGFQWIAGARVLDRFDVELVQASTFRTLQTDVLSGPAMGLLILTLGWADRALTGRGRWAVAASGVLLVLLMSVHAQDASTIVVVATAAAAIRWLTAPPGGRRHALVRGAVVLAGMFAIAAPLAAYHAWTVFSDPSFVGYRGLRNPYLTSSWPELYGLVLIAAVIGAGAICRRRERRRLMLVVWPVSLALLLAMPVGIPLIHTYMGLHVVLCALATRGLWAVGRTTAALLKPSAVAAPVLAVAGLVAFVGAASLTNGLVFLHDLRPMTAAPPRYLRDDEAAALRFIDNTVGPDEVVACVEFPGVILPVWTGSRAYVGDVHITPNGEERKRLMDRLMGADGRLTARDVAAILAAARIDYVYVEPAARALGAADTEAVLVGAGLADRLFTAPNAAVYRVKKSALSRVLSG